MIGVAPPVAASLVAYILNERTKRRQSREDRETERLQFEREKKYDKTREGFEYVLSSLRRAQLNAAYERITEKNPNLKWRPGKTKVELTKEQAEDFDACLQAIPRLMVYDDTFDLQKVLDSLEHRPEALADLRTKLDMLLARIGMRKLHETYLPFECALASLTLLEAPERVVTLSRSLIMDLIDVAPKMDTDKVIGEIQGIMQNHLSKLAGKDERLAEKAAHWQLSFKRERGKSGREQKQGTIEEGTDAGRTQVGDINREV
ncbi:MAG: hypothetical protein KJ653_04985 [Candidatus Thermoplasmatota archaeon]|nr:hypothetical protein [Candidatus Thermoplasmatota archaeon]MBU1915016.1 hypothetical protein [Candidatus Thermoplasmatota archaeon]